MARDADMLDAETERLLKLYPSLAESALDWRVRLVTVGRQERGLLEVYVARAWRPYKNMRTHAQYIVDGHRPPPVFNYEPRYIDINRLSSLRSFSPPTVGTGFSSFYSLTKPWEHWLYCSTKYDAIRVTPPGSEAVIETQAMLHNLP